MALLRGASPPTRQTFSRRGNIPMHLVPPSGAGNCKQRRCGEIRETFVSVGTPAPDQTSRMPAFARKYGHFYAKCKLQNIRWTGWWARQDSNLEPDGYEPSALTIELQALRQWHFEGPRLAT